MTWGNFQRKLLGHIRRTWTVNREIIAAIYNTVSKKRITGEDVFPFGMSHIPEPMSEKDRELMRKIHEHRLKHGKR
jgi:hypothetical protein